MTTLNHDQIEAVYQWLINWEQLKDTGIPLRFREEWEELIPTEKKIEKPPLGLTPKWIRDQERQMEIMAAINRYMAAGKNPPKEWAIEFASLCTPKNTKK